MKKKAIIALLSFTMLTGVLVSCSSTKDVVDDTKHAVEKGTDMTKDAVEKGTDMTKDALEKGTDMTKDALEKGKEMITGDKTEGKVVENYTDNKKVSDYNLENFKSDMESKGYDVKIISKTKDFFDAPKFEVEIGNAKVSVYDYEEMTTLEKDISAITEKGHVVSGTKLTWSKAPHYYKKGELLVIYDGDDTEIINSLEQLLGVELYK